MVCNKLTQKGARLMTFLFLVQYTNVVAVVHVLQITQNLLQLLDQLHVYYNYNYNNK